MISIVIPLYNKEKEIADTLRCVMEQSSRDFEVVVVDDGSTDGSLQAVEEFARDERIRVVRRPNGGVGAARNTGVENARGEYVAFLDADDLWDRDYLSIQEGLIRRFPDCGIFGTEYSYLNTDGTVTPARIDGSQLGFREEEGVIGDYFHLASVSNPPLWTSATVVRKDALQRVGGFPEGVKSGEDLLTWARLACREKIAYSRKRAATYVLGHSVPRPPEKRDVVGEELEKLQRANGGNRWLRAYVANWYKMRMSRCLAARMYGKALKAFCKAFGYRPFDLRLFHACLKFFWVGVKRRKQG